MGLIHNVNNVLQEKYPSINVVSTPINAHPLALAAIDICNQLSPDQIEENKRLLELILNR